MLPKPMFEITAKGLSIKALPVNLPTPRRTVVLVVLKKRTLSSIAQLFIETLLSVAKPRPRTRREMSGQ